MIPKELSKIRIDFLQTFIELIHVKSFSIAASRLGITQGTVSQHLKELEKAFGDVELIKRSSKLFEITSEGELVYEAMKKIVNNIERLREKLIAVSDGRKVVIKIAASSIPGVYTLPRIIMKLQLKFPNIEFDIDITNSQEALKQLHTRNVKFCAVGGLFENLIPEKDMLVIEEDDIYILARKDHPVHLWLRDVGDSITENDLFSKLTEFPWVFREKGSATRDWFEKNWSSDKKINIALDFHDNLAIINAIRKSNAITALSSKVYENIARNREIMPIKHKYLPDISRKFYFIKLNDDELSDLEINLWNSIVTEIMENKHLKNNV